MRFVLGLVGVLAGIAVDGGADQWFYVAAGAAIGFACGWLSDLSDEVRRLRRIGVPSPTPAPRPAASPAPPVATTVASPSLPWVETAREPIPPRPAVWAPALRWLLAGNVPVKVGVLVSFFGVAFLLKYAADHQLLNVPPGVRLAVIAGVGAGLGAFGWSLRNRMRAYALGLQGGAVGILYLTIYAAFRLYALIPAGPAFALLFVVAVAAGALAYVQQAQALAVLGSIGGFLAPLLASTGEGSHVALFGYYLVLNGAIFGLAWFTAWRGLNLIGFAFTFVVGAWWGYDYYRPELYASTQPFLIAFFLIYTLIAVLYAFRQPPRLQGIVDATLVFGTPVLALPLQVALLRDTEYGVGYSAVAASLIYASLAYGLRRLAPRTAQLLVEALAALSIAFATVAIPQFLDAHWTAGSWALEGAAMVWVGVRQRRALLRTAGAALVFAAGFAHIVTAFGGGAAAMHAVFNADFIAGFLIACAGFIGATQLGTPRLARARYEGALRIALFAWGATWWLAIGIDEARDYVGERHRLDAMLLYLAASVALGAWWAARSRQPLFSVGTRAWLPAALVLLAVSVSSTAKAHPLAGIGWFAWPAAVAAHYYAVGRAGVVTPVVRERWRSVGLWLIAAVAAFEVAWWVGDAADAWRVFAVVFACLLVVGAALRIARSRDAGAWLHFGALPILEIMLVYLIVQNLSHGGGEAGLYVPLLNPMDLAAFGLLWLGARWARAAAMGRAADYAIAVAGWLFLTFAVIRAVHQLAGMPYDSEAAFASMTLQAALSLVWGLAALVGMVVGARRGARPVWIAGGALMAVVVAKLFLLDLGSSGTIERIVSFIGVGALLLVVGYLAPVPSRR